MAIIGALLLGLGGAGGLWLVYFALRSAWPTAYVALSDTYALTFGATIWRLSLFRVAPTLLLALALVVTSWRIGVVDWIAVAVAVGIHLAHTNLRAIVQYFAKGRAAGHVNYSGYHLWTAGILVFSATAGAVLAPALERFVPTPAALVENLWIAGSVAVVGAALLRVASTRAARQDVMGPSYFVVRATEDVGIEVLDQLFSESVRTGCDPLLLKSILVCEVLQRPKWMRRLEWFKAEMILPGTYGVMQVRASEPVSDMTSIQIVAKNLEGRWGTGVENVGEDDPYMDDQFYFMADRKSIWSAAGRHNGDKAFIDGVAEVYVDLHSTPFEFHEHGRSLKILEVRRYPESFGIRFITNAKRVELRYGLGRQAEAVTSFDPGQLRAGEILVDGKESDAWLVLDRVRIARIDLSEIIPMSDVAADKDSRGTAVG